MFFGIQSEKMKHTLHTVHTDSYKILEILLILWHFRLVAEMNATQKEIIKQSFQFAIVWALFCWMWQYNCMVWIIHIIKIFRVIRLKFCSEWCTAHGKSILQSILTVFYRLPPTLSPSLTHNFLSLSPASSSLPLYFTQQQITMNNAKSHEVRASHLHQEKLSMKID